jgi:DNA-binding response OmpR family regulator
MHISVLRRKLGDDAAQPRYIATVRGVGFRFERGDRS